MGLNNENSVSNKSTNEELMNENDDGDINKRDSVDEEELIRRCVKLADFVFISFQLHFGSFRKVLAEDSIPSVLKISSVEELRDIVKSFIGSISKNRKLTAKKKTELANYGMRAFTVS